MSLVDHDAWVEAGAANDPFDDRPALTECAPDGWKSEALGDEASLQVETRLCRYLAVSQPSQVDLRKGELLRVRLFHFQLSAPAPTEAHVALQIGDVRWQQRVAIPSESAVITGEVAIDGDIETGTPVVFHLHNHGENSWNLIEVSTGR